MGGKKDGYMLQVKSERLQFHKKEDDILKQKR
jgi:hypothetical protein